VNLDQRVIVLKQGLYQFVHEIRIQGFLTDHHIPDANGGDGLIHPSVHTT
jgi:hypothetical protein